MICYALGICFNFENISWYVPGNEYDSNHFFSKRLLAKWKNNIAQLCNELEHDSCITMQRDNHSFYALKSVSGYIVVDCDTVLNSSQIRWLFYHLLVKRYPLPDVANNLEAYTQDFKVAAIRKDLQELTIKLKEDLEKTFERGDKIEHLLAKTGDLVTHSVSFRKVTPVEEPCWSPCVLL